MPFKLTIVEQAKVGELLTTARQVLTVLNDSIELFNTGKDPFRIRLDAALENYNETMLDGICKFTYELSRECLYYHDEKPEKWQDGRHGDANRKHYRIKTYKCHAII